MFRNFINSLRRYTLASILNIIGLSVAFAAFIIIMMQVNYELKYDKFHPDHERIYKVDLAYNDGGGMAIQARGFVNTFGASSPMIECYTLFEPAWQTSYFTIQKNGSKVGFREDIQYVYSDFPKLFGITMVEGSADALKDPNKAILPMSLARKFFGDESVIGKIMTFNDDDLVEIGGVYQDLPTNSQIASTIYMLIPESHGRDKAGNDRWGSHNFPMYVKLIPGANPRQVEDDFLKNFNLAAKYEKTNGVKVALKPISSIYYDNREITFDMATHGNRNSTGLMFGIALLIMAIAAINFVNFSTSLAPTRMKGINIQKLFGASNLKLRLILLSEAIGLCILSFGLALVMVYTLGDSGFKNMVIGGITFDGNSIETIIQAGIAAILMGIVAGVYPAVYTTKFPPIMVLRGSFAMSPKGRMLRTALISFQFIVSIGLIIVALFMNVQNSYIKNMDTGFKTDNIATIELGGKLMNNKAFRDKLKQSPLIKDVALSYSLVGGSNVVTREGAVINNEDVPFNLHRVSWNFPDVMGLTMAEGETFSENDTRLESYTYIFNEAATKKHNIHAGQTFNSPFGFRGPQEALIKGIVKDFNFQSLHNRIEPMTFVLTPEEWMNVAYAQISGNPYQAVEHIRKVAAEIDPAFPIDIQFYDEVFNNLYQKDQKSMKLITFFSLLAIVISLVGVFGLVVFETQYRRKEIGLRRINGATVESILVMFNKKFVTLVGVCFAISAPIAWYGIDKWLSNFAYRTPLHWWVFALALLTVLAVTIITVTAQSWRAATENPVKSLKSE